MKLITQIVSVIVFWALVIGWTWIEKHNFSINDLYGTAVAFIVGIVIVDLVDRNYKNY